MFNGFGRNIDNVFNDIMFDNTRSHFDTIKSDYDKTIRTPLIELYNDLIPVVQSIDPAFCIDKRRCISSVYNDFRFSRNNPIKEYMYIKFTLLNQSNKNLLGFFIDFSVTGVRYGLQLYKPILTVMSKLLDPLSDFSCPDECEIYIGGSQAFKKKVDDTGIKYNNMGNSPSLMICVNHSGTSELTSTEILKNLTELFYCLSDIYYLMKNYTI